MQKADEAEKNKTLQGFLTRLGLVSSSSSPHFVFHDYLWKFSRAVFLCFYFSVQRATSPSSLVSSWMQRELWDRVNINVQPECLWAQRSESKWLSELWLLPPSTRQTQLICSLSVKSHSLLLLHTASLQCVSLTLCWTGCVKAFQLYSLFLPLACFTPHSLSPGGKVGINCTVFEVVVWSQSANCATFFQSMSVKMLWFILCIRLFLHLWEQTWLIA